MLVDKNFFQVLYSQNKFLVTYSITGKKKTYAVCNYKVRSKPRNRIYKEKYQEQMDKNSKQGTLYS
ncbi:MAG: hypothetical protein COY74_09370 [Nitrosopumilales archaeon CG_4_10_14_0_8_um_filter_34_8]|nr:MAG: hypothetical protein COY74_09370 [Nitrosopumilales archaeon CG_4_10_14_0_8_um_filter_34_8]PJB96289.1 MAG: hypothetical protein CO079_10260 [Nitrosopumilales archaeon CG_4_9_14_0_8_um_filter_34_10]